METIKAEIDLPISLTGLIKIEKDDLCSFIKRSLAVGAIPRGKAFSW